MTAAEGLDGSGTPGIAYADLTAAAGFGCLAAWWRDGRDPDGIHLSFVSERGLDGVNAFRLQAKAWEDVAGIVRSVLAGDRRGSAFCERDSIAAVCPPPPGYVPASPHPGLFSESSLYPSWAAAPVSREAHRGMARAAVTGAALPRAMKRALHDFLDAGPPLPSRRLEELRARSGTAQWETLALCATHPLVAEAALGGGLSDRSTVLADLLGIGLDAPAALGRMWPGLDAARLRRLRGVRRQDLGDVQRHVRDADAWEDALALAAEIPPEHIPGPGGWAAFSAVAMAVSQARASAPPAVTEGLSSGLGCDWDATLARLLAASGARAGMPADEAARHVVNAANDLGDAVEAVAGSLVAPLLAHERLASGVPDPDGDGTLDALMPEARDAAAALVLAQGSLRSLLEASRRWHAHAGAVDAETRVQRDTSWPALIAPTPVGGLLAVPLHSVDDLAAEGASGPDASGAPGLSHCIATRAGHLEPGHGHALSFRLQLPGGRHERLSTAQVRVLWGEDRPRLAVDEHRGYGNSDPPREAARALALLLAAVEDGAVPLLPEALEFREVPDHDPRCGYDWRDPAMLARAVAAHAPVLPRWARGLDGPGLLAALRERGALPPAPEPEAPFRP